ncbi:hypothetical protein FNF27_04510 [Cafeteria roenbergensis]|uniref:DUF985 domain-containing protein n=1 Tax=Cafeteria roenbergensis TaxID=33653 RepID=A0A5A8D3V8_CAFRO|nr:hypothetical protein FNF29_06219 [Cafeteria roenbergensis]KAA0158737.1 hypothetical protein FNF31_05263 [Cafeteria roenbergensis]KAA0159484.1 hypothetical protein FNF28_05841 [Cafeteria roenbergensis]KAA0173949.1 hypothetical protein FNF27_04510 [Cafeteria roenbergensis]|eukprot:KAA0149131.1 hypothetical protein FNF29_06219 [Cafeteria roenbergensis]
MASSTEPAGIADSVPAAAKALIDRLGLEGHREGGFFRRVYESDAKIEGDLTPGAYAGGPRHVMTHIFFLLTRGQVSHLHKIASDELWHFYGGDPLTVVEADPKTGSVLETTIGREVAAPFHAVPAGKWFGARAEGEWSLVGCTVAPGFDFADFVLADRATAERELGAELAAHPAIAPLVPQ